MTNYATGHLAEQEAAEFLESIGFMIMQLNWKTKYCEIDIVAKKAKTIYFVEVKYRAKTTQGVGFDYITPKKLNQMKFATRMWLSEQKWEGDCILAAIAASPSGFELIEIVD